MDPAQVLIEPFIGAGFEQQDLREGEHRHEGADDVVREAPDCLDGGFVGLGKAQAVFPLLGPKYRFGSSFVTNVYNPQTRWSGARWLE